MFKSLREEKDLSDVTLAARIASSFCSMQKKRWYFIKHRKDCETALWAKKGFIESQPLIERKALLKERIYRRNGPYGKSFVKIV